MPSAFYNPLHLLWISVLPLLLLLLIDLQSIWLAYGEMDPKQHSFAKYALSANAGLLAFAAALALVLWRRKKSFNSGWSLLLFLLHAGFIWLQLYLLDKALPFSVPNWILDRDTLFLAQLACVMGGCFYSLLGIACCPLRISRMRDFLYSGGMLLGVPLFWYLMIQVVVHIHILRFAPNIFLVVTFLILSTAVMCIGLLRLLVYLHAWLRQYEAVLVLLSALIMPLGGLCLNRAMPFPVSFQVTGVYVLTIVNAAFLLLGCLPRLRSNSWLWLVQAVTFPFTVYFFVVFLPFLPLFLPAMLACGAGFLILTPTVLFMVHGQRLIGGFHGARKQWGPAAAACGLLAALLLMPGWFVTQAMLDRASLCQGLDYVYSPQLQPRQAFSGNPKRVCHTLENLQKFKQSFYLPILSNLYNWAVFDNLSLPDAKIDEVYETFSGTKAPPPAVDRANGLATGFFETNRQANRGMGRRPLKLPWDQVSVTSHATTETVDGDCVRADAVICMKNSATVANEFIGTFEIPDDVLVSGYWLHIGNERVPGRLFEKKTALWVYEQIRDTTRRDPGILRYIGPNTVEMRVYPIAHNETRTAEIQFLYPRTSHPQILLNKEPLLPVSLEKTATVSEVALPPWKSVLLVNGAADGIPRTEQKAYLHFIVDRSVRSEKQTSAELVVRLKKLAASPEFAGITQYKVSLANYESALLTPKPVSWAGVEQVISGGTLSSVPARGGFAVAKSLKEEILEYESGMDCGKPETFSSYPVFAVVDDSVDMPHPDEALPFLLRAGTYPVYRSSPDGKLQALWSGNNETQSTRKALVLAAGRNVCVFPDISKARVWLEFVPDASPVRVFDPGSGTFPVEVQTVHVGNPAYQAGLEAMALQQDMNRNPSKTPKLLPQITRQSRDSGILAPSTSYIVVENSAQWKILQLKERQKLGAHEALELEDTPEPATWMLLAVFLPFLFLWRRWRAKRMGTNGLKPNNP